MAALTKRQQDTLKKHSKHHSAKHMAMMRKEMRAGKSFTAAHKKAQKAVGKWAIKANTEGKSYPNDPAELEKQELVPSQHRQKCKPE